MKIAFSSSGNNLESQLDPRFGRCPKFLIVDLDTMDIDVFENDQFHDDSAKFMRYERM